MKSIESPETEFDVYGKARSLTSEKLKGEKYVR